MRKWYICLLVIGFMLTEARGQFSLDFLGGLKHKSYNSQLIDVHDSLSFLPDIQSSFRLNLGLGLTYRFNKYLALKSQFNLSVNESPITRIYEFRQIGNFFGANSAPLSRKTTAMNIPVEMNLHFGKHISVFTGLGVLFQSEHGHVILEDETFSPLFNATIGVYKSILLTGSYGAALHWRRWSLLARHQINLTDVTEGFTFNDKQYRYPVELRQWYFQFGYSLPLGGKKKEE